MIIGKKDKEKIELLEKENSNLKYDLQRGVANVEINEGLENLAKAILKKIGGEITIDYREIYEAESANIYVTDDIMRNAKRVMLLSSKNRVKDAEDFKKN